ncbi:hypothetical protein [Qipengyuania sp.]|uniref:hypothetical protein n=1 Tax=Qipengyuania sp. TaxID=2004515 RepID=UPI0035C83ECC
MTGLIVTFVGILCIALVSGQVGIIRRALNDERAGIGRFTYAKGTNPELFWLILIVEMSALVTVTVYLLGLAFAVLR